MKKLNFLVIALVAILGFSSCDNNNWIATDYSDDLVGTWTCFDGDYAEALVIKEDGTLVTKEYVKGRKNVYSHPAIADYNRTTDSANKTVSTLMKIIISLRKDDVTEEDDPLLQIIAGGSIEK